jgi:hypothetical protein
VCDRNNGTLDPGCFLLNRFDEQAIEVVAAHRHCVRAAAARPAAFANAPVRGLEAGHNQNYGLAGHGLFRRLQESAAALAIGREAVFGKRLVDAIVEAADELVLPGLASGALLACVD